MEAHCFENLVFLWSGVIELKADCDELMLHIEHQEYPQRDKTKKYSS